MGTSGKWIGALLGSALAMTAATASENVGGNKLAATPVADGMYVLQGGGGNIGASIGPDGIVLVDAGQTTKVAEQALSMLRTLSGGRQIAIRYLINTHYHYDHTNGNEVIARAGAAVLSHPKLRKRLRDGGLAGNGGSYRVDVPPGARDAIPTLVYEREVVIHLNGEEIRVAHLSEGHTDGDTIVFFKKANVVQMGDVFPRYGYPFIDVYGGGSIDGMIGACEEVLRTVPSDARVIPGHGDVATVDDLRQYLEMLKQTRAVVFDASTAGRSLDQMRQDRILSKWSARYASDIVPEDMFLEMLYYSFRSPQR